MESKSDIWALYGLNSNPFITDPILLKGGLLKMDWFVGREKEQKELFKRLDSRTGSRTLVIGDIGVGKTSFVNYVRYNAIDNPKSRKQYFTHIKEISVEDDWTYMQFMVDTIYSLYSSIRNSEDGKSMISDALYKKLESIGEINIVSSMGFGVNILGSGIDYNSGRSNPQVLSYGVLSDLINDVADEVYKNTKREIVLHYNNLDNVQRSNPETIEKLFKNLRDLFQITHIHFVFVANMAVANIIEGLPKMSSIFSEPILINEMTYEEVQQIIDIRLQNLRLNDVEYIKPFDNGTLKLLFDLYKGNIRFILNSLETAVEAVTQNKPVVLGESDCSRILSNIIETKYLKDITKPRAREVLYKIAEKEEITNRGLAFALNMPRSQISIYTGDLKDKGCIYEKRRDGKDKFWSAKSDFKWLLLNKNFPNDLNQKLLKGY